MFCSRDIQILDLYENHRFQNRWRHHRYCYIMEITLSLFLLNLKYYQNEIWLNTTVLYDKHF